MNLKILVVEDNDIDLEIIKFFLEKRFNNLFFAKSVDEALNVLEKEKIDILITDLELPKKNGFELIKQAKNIFKIIASSYYDTNYLLKAIELDVDGFLIKPIEEDLLNQTLDKVINIIKHKKNEEKYLTLLNQYKEAVDEVLIVSKTNKKGIITYVNDEFCKISGYTKEELIGKPHNIVKHPDMKKEVFKEMWEKILNKKSFRGIIKNRKKNGESYYVDTLIKPILDENKEIIEFIALRKDITFLMNPKNLAKDKVKVLKNPLVIGIKINEFKNITIAYGELIEKIKQELARKIKKSLTFDKVDEFILDDDKIIFVTQKNDFKLENIYLVKVDNFDIYLSVNIAYATEGVDLVENVINALDEENEKIFNANNFLINKKNKAKENLIMLNKITTAIENNNIISYFQPIINNTTLKCEKFESLVRLKDKDKIISPFFFMDISKKAGLYPEISKIVLKNSIECLKKCNKEISINFAPNDMNNKIIIDYFFELIDDVDNSKITVEFLEDNIISGNDLIDSFLKECKKRGIKIAIDDFGVGFSNFIRIINYEIDILKIDGALIKEIDKNNKKRDIIETIVTFAKKENIITIAEFVENERIFNILKEIGIDYSQGYFFSKPLSLEEAIKFNER